MAKYIDGPENRGGINYYTLLITPPAVSKNDPPKLPLDLVSASKLFMLNGNFVVVDRTGRWLFWNIKAGIDSELNTKLLAALKWAEENCSPQTKDPSLHIGFWRRYCLHIKLSSDSTIGGGLTFCDQPGVHEFLQIIDQWFRYIDEELYNEYCSVTPDAKRVLGESFLMAVLNKGGVDQQLALRIHFSDLFVHFLIISKQRKSYTRT